MLRETLCNNDIPLHQQVRQGYIYHMSIYVKSCKQALVDFRFASPNI